MVREKFCNPLFLSVFICVLIIYLNAEHIPEKNGFTSIIPKEKVTKLSGYISSSPARTSKGTFYSCQMKVFSSCDGNVESDCFGNIKVFVPSDYVEAFFPGKIFSGTGAETIIETGSYVELEGRFSDDVFFGKKVLSCKLEPNRKNKIKILRAKGRLKFKRMMYAWGPAGGFLLALLSGSREYTEVYVAENFKKAGLSHILALSGMHLSMFSGLAVFLGTKLRRKRITLVFQLVSVSAFVWFAGFSPSLLRAFICLFIVLFQGILSLEKSDMLTVLCFSFFTQCMISPNDLLNTGFILSYGALCGILITGEFLRKIYSFCFPKFISSSLASSTGAQMITLPVSAKMFGMITPVGIVSSVFVSPFVTLFIYSGLFFIVTGLLFPPICCIGEFFMRIQYNLISSMVGFFAKVPAFVF
ncbi:MAG: ComEC/Rec2 family competence protein [Treponema sp.]|nr:ComEC/Rec2 family competence protein [Treponema sp.]